MPFEKKLGAIQNQLSQQNLDGWLLYDFRRHNDLACELLEIPLELFITRRFLYWIPARGRPIKIVHAIESGHLDHLPGEKLCYHAWQELEMHIAKVLSGSLRIAMEYSPRNALPYVSKVDAGTMEVIRGFGVEVESSADLLQHYTSVWDAHKLDTHLAAAKVLDETAASAWQFIAKALRSGQSLTEYDVQQHIMEEFSKNNCTTEGLPICAVNAHSADPHYAPSKDKSARIKINDFILIDLWCKQNVRRSVYADITRVGVAAARPTEKQIAVFNIVRQAQQAAVELVRQRFAHDQPVRGWEVDQAARQVIATAGYGDYFIHRTGHNIDVKDHGNGAHIDNLESHDYRQLLKGTCFSIEPGIYLPEEFGVRLEFDVFIRPDGGIDITGGIQDSIVCLL